MIRYNKEYTCQTCPKKYFCGNRQAGKDGKFRCPNCAQERRKEIDVRATLLDSQTNRRAVDRARYRKFGITDQDYDYWVADQKGLCKICNREPTDGYALNVDHCHKTNRLRDLLCRKCNLGLGTFDDDPIRLMEAAKYILAWQEKHAKLEKKQNGEANS